MLFYLLSEGFASSKDSLRQRLGVFSKHAESGIYFFLDTKYLVRESEALAESRNAKIRE